MLGCYALPDGPLGRRSNLFVNSVIDSSPSPTTYSFTNELIPTNDRTLVISAAKLFDVRIICVIIGKYILPFRGSASSHFPAPLGNLTHYQTCICIYTRSNIATSRRICHCLVSYLKLNRRSAAPDLNSTRGRSTSTNDRNFSLPIKILKRPTI